MTGGEEGVKGVMCSVHERREERMEESESENVVSVSHLTTMEVNSKQL